MGAALAEPEVEEGVDLDLSTLFEDLWAVIVWNDDVNTFEHVIDCFIKFLGHDTGRAEKLAMEVHETGKACVACRPKDEAEIIVHALLDNQIQATMARA